MEDNFQISMYALGKGTIKFQVEVFYRSDVVVRFKLTAGKKEIQLEKRLLAKTNKWRILNVNYEIKNIDSSTAWNLSETYKILDEKISGKSRIAYRDPSQRGENK